MLYLRCTIQINSSNVSKNQTETQYSLSHIMTKVGNHYEAVELENLVEGIEI